MFMIGCAVTGGGRVGGLVTGAGRNANGWLGAEPDDIKAHGFHIHIFRLFLVFPRCPETAIGILSGDFLGKCFQTIELGGNRPLICLQIDFV